MPGSPAARANEDFLLFSISGGGGKPNKIQYINSQGFPGGSGVKNMPAMQETQLQSLGQEDPMEEEMATHSSILS